MYKRKDGNYETTKTYPEGKIHFYGKSEAIVLKKIAAYEEKRIAGDIKSPAFSRIAAQWEKEKFNKLSDGSIRSYAPVLKSVVKHFGRQQMNKISTRDIQLYLDSLDLAYKTVKNHYTVINQIFNYACVNDVLKNNPCQFAKVPTNLRRSTRDALTKEQIEIIKQGSKNEFQLAFFILNTGCRLGEALALQGKDIDLARGYIYITKAVHFKGNKAVIGTTKTEKSKRMIPITSALDKRIRELNVAPDEYFFGGDQPITRMALTRRWESGCRSKGFVEVIHIDNPSGETHGKHATKYKTTIDRHSIRHTYATLLFDAGVDIKTSQTILGHSNMQTTYDIYTHVSEDHLKAAKKKLKKVLS